MHTHIGSCRGSFTPFETERRFILFWKIHKMKKLEFRNGIYTVLRPLCYLCKIFGLESHSYVADSRNKGVTTDYGYLNYMFAVKWLIVYTVGLPVHILEVYTVEVVSQIM